MPTDKQLAHLKKLNNVRLSRGLPLFHFDAVTGKLVDPQKVAKLADPPPPKTPVYTYVPASAHWDAWRKSEAGRKAVDAPMPHDTNRAWGELEARLKIAFIAGNKSAKVQQEVDI